MGQRAIDGLVNVAMGEGKAPDWLIRVKEDYFKAGQEMLRNTDMAQLLGEMDACGVERAILTIQLAEPSRHVLSFVDRHPERFALSVSGVDLLQPMPSLWRLEQFVRDHPVARVLVAPSFWGDGRYPPGDAIYYPLYAKCVELDLPLAVNTGIPGPPLPAQAQHPIHLDRVCLRFPELRLCMAHGADPWWGVAIRLMIKYRNLYLMTSAWSPRHLPAELIHFMNTRGQDKVLFASDAPVLSMTRCLREAAELDLRPGVLDKYLYANAQGLFFRERRPRHP
jgi:predicted TIM-barrel fold metal-dependent hydrolase